MTPDDLAHWPPEEGEAESESSPTETGAEPPDQTERSGSRPLQAVLLLLCIAGVVAFNVWRLRVDLPPPTTAEQDAAARASLLVASEEIRAYEDRNGEPPPSLAELGLDGLGLDYEVGDDGFELRASGSSGVIRAGPDESPADLVAPLSGDSDSRAGGP